VSHSHIWSTNTRLRDGGSGRVILNSPFRSARLVAFTRPRCLRKRSWQCRACMTARAVPSPPAGGMFTGRVRAVVRRPR